MTELRTVALVTDTALRSRSNGRQPSGQAAPGPAPRGAAERVRDMPAYVWFMTAGLVATLFAGNWEHLHIPLGLDRPLYIAALALVVLDARAPRLRWRSVYAIMVSLVLWTAWSWFSTGSATDPYKAFMLTDRIVTPFLMFGLGPIVYSTVERRNLLLKTMTVVGIYLGTTAIFEIAHLNPLVWPSYIMDPAVGIGFGRARGPFVASEPLGMTCGIAMFMAALLFSRSRGTWRAAAVAAMFLCFTGSLLSMTRTNWIATVVGAVVVGLFIPRIRRRLPLAAGVVAALVGIAVFSLPELLTSLQGRLTDQRPIYDRLNTNAAALRIIESHPVFGVGWGNFIDVNVDWVRQADTYPVTSVNIEVHNVFLSRAAETGVLGAALWVAAMFLGPVAGIVSRPPTRELHGWRLVAMAIFPIWLLPSLGSPNPYPMPNNLVWLIGGIASQHLLLRALDGRSRARPSPLIVSGKGVERT